MCAWQYGWDLAEGDAQSRGVPNPRSYRWWLDVETINSWQSGATLNRADCRLAPLTGGGTVTVTQWKTRPANSDFSCPPPPKVKGR